MSVAPSPEPGSEHRTLIDELLGEQRALTAVERFSKAHAKQCSTGGGNIYRDLLPLHAPVKGEQYAFEVDLDKCSGCKACVTACHSMNGLDENETWRSVGLLFSDDWRKPFLANVTTACHHCVEPGCLKGCPTRAYDKDPRTGIVRHLDTECIGCQYCTMMCPYDVPKYSARRGIVRKCDMCSSRLGRGEAPACVQSCPSQAIRITVVNQFATTTGFRQTSENNFLPASPAPAHTIPTTRYNSSSPLTASLLAGDHAQISPAKAHASLVFLLVISQLAVGVSLAAPFLEPRKWLARAAVISGAIAFAVGALHLGQPLRAWRAFRGWRTSWFSREIIAFGIFLPIAALSSARNGAPSLAYFTPVAGVIAVACSAMIYAKTGREFWRASQSFGKFFGTTVVLGAAMTLALGAIAGIPKPEQSQLELLVVLATAAKLGFEHRIFLNWVDDETPAPSPLNKTARLLQDQLGVLARLRILCGLIGGVIMPVLSALNVLPFTAAAVASMLAILLVGELLERFLFFTAVSPVKMPGGYPA
jgi:formate dehydrogenase iron-sulfur subunit